jgi:hypothetical protein
MVGADRSDLLIDPNLYNFKMRHKMQKVDLTKVRVLLE